MFSTCKVWDLCDYLIMSSTFGASQLCVKAREICFIECQTHTKGPCSLMSWKFAKVNLNYLDRGSLCTKLCNLGHKPLLCFAVTRLRQSLQTGNEGIIIEYMLHAILRDQDFLSVNLQRQIKHVMVWHRMVRPICSNICV